MSFSIPNRLPRAKSREHIRIYDLYTDIPNWITYTRTGIATAVVEGELTIFQADEIRATEYGWLIEESRVNYLTSYNYQIVDTAGITTSGDGTISISNDYTNLQTSGLSLTVATGVVYTFDNTSGTDYGYMTFSGTVNSTDDHTMSVYASVPVGGVDMYLTGQESTSLTLTTSNTYLRNYLVQTPAATTDQMIIRVAAGSKISFVLQQLEKGGFPTSVIPSASGAAKVRGQDIIDANYHEVFKNHTGSLAFYATSPSALTGTANSRLFAIGESSSDRIAGWMATNQAFRLFGAKSGVSNSTTPFTWAFGTELKVAFRFSPLRLEMRDSSTLTTLSLDKLYIPIMTKEFTVKLGRNVADVNFWNGYIRKIAISQYLEDLNEMLNKVDFDISLYDSAGYPLYDASDEELATTI